jgi:sugar lactone lactonase YvrE
MRQEKAFLVMLTSETRTALTQPLPTAALSFAAGVTKWLEDVFYGSRLFDAPLSARGVSGKATKGGKMRNQAVRLVLGTLLLATAAHAQGGRHVPSAAERVPGRPGVGSRADLVTLCHRAPGRQEASRTIQVGPGAVSIHLAHGDTLGVCGAQSHWIATTLVGAQDVAATSFGLGYPAGVAIDGAGRIYVADYLNNRIDRIEGTTLTRIAGTGVAGYSGDGGPATAAQLRGPNDVALDAQGRLYVSDNNNCVRRIDTKGIITRIAGDCVSNYMSSGDGGPALDATFGGVASLAVDAQGRVYIADVFGQVVRRIDENGIIDRVAGTGNAGTGGDGGPATSADLSNPLGVSIDSAGALYIADSGNAAVRKVEQPGPPSQPGTIHTVAGVLGEVGLDPDGPVATTRFFFPVAAAVDPNGLLTVVDMFNDRILQVIGPNIVTVAGGVSGTGGFSGDGGPAASALLSAPQDVAFDATGRMVIADTYNNRLRLVDTDATRTIDTLAGSGAHGVDGDHAAATSAPYLFPVGVAVDAQGNVFLSDGYDQVSDALRRRVRRVDTTGTITTLGGIVDPNASPLLVPDDVAVDSQGRVYVVDLYGAVWRADATTMVPIAGGGMSTAEGVLATEAFLLAQSIAFDSLDRLYVSVASGPEPGAIRRIDVPDGTTGTIVTVVGGGSDTGDTSGPGALLQAQLTYPQGIAFDTSGRLYIADAGERRIVRVDFEAPSLTRIAGGPANTESGENVPPLLARMDPTGIALDVAGNLYYVDWVTESVRRIDAGLTAVTSVAGSQTGLQGDFGDGDLATGARLFVPSDVAVDRDGGLLITDTHNHRVRRIGTDGVIKTIAGDVSPEGLGQAAQARLADPRALAFMEGTTLVAGGASGTVQAVRGDWVDAVIGRYPQTQPTQDLARFRDRTFGTVEAIAVETATRTLYVVESDRIQRVTMDPLDDSDAWTIAPFANDAGTPGYADGDIATAAFRSPGGLHHDGQDLYVADTGNHAMRLISGSAVTTIAGQGEQSGFAGDDGPAVDALLDHPQAITKCPNGDLFVADTGNNRVRRIHAGVISTVVEADTPRGVACDASGNLFVSATDTVRLLQAVDGIVDGTGSVRTIYSSSTYTCLAGLVVLDADAVQVADQCTGVLVELRRQGP